MGDFDTNIAFTRKTGNVFLAYVVSLHSLFSDLHPTSNHENPQKEREVLAYFALSLLAFLIGD